MKITYRVTREDYLSAVNLFFKNQKPRYRRVFRFILPWLGVVLLLLEIFSEFVLPHRDPVTVVAGTVMGLYFVYCGFALRFYFRRAYKKNPVYRHEFSADISDDGIHVVTATSETQYKWAGFVRYIESDNLFMLYLTDVNYVALPKHAFTPGEIETFQGLLQNHISIAS
jgi:hypothetical protein